MSNLCLVPWLFSSVTRTVKQCYSQFSSLFVLIHCDRIIRIPFIQSFYDEKDRLLRRPK